LPRGEIREIPYPVLLTALARSHRTVVVRMEKKPVEKELFFDDGAPVDCRSNLVHETFGRFLVTEGRLSEEQLHETLSESFTREVPLGEILLERELLEPVEMYKLLQQSLARKLLDGFTWKSGTFETEDEEVDSETGLRVNTPQLVLTGVVKLSPMKEVTGAIQPWLSEALALSPEPAFGPEELRLPGPAKGVVDALGERPREIDDLAAATEIGGNDLGRILYALALLGVVVPASRVRGRTPRRIAASESEEVSPRTPEPRAGGPGPEADRREVMEAFLSYKRKDAFDLLDVPEDVDRPSLEEAWLRFAARFAPWELESAGDDDLTEKARILFLAGSEAYAELADHERRGELLQRRRRTRERRARGGSRPKIETDLLDPAVQYRKGKRLLEEGKHSKALEFLRFAADVDPQNALYRAEAAYCQYELSPLRHREESLEELREAVRIDPASGPALYYLGLVEMEEERFAEAEDHLRKAIKPMAPDRRPIEALKELAARKKRS
ncbi:MAG: DUF4388 domain-containing protein, partial [Thermoanaerobaculia bacterium]|nr:DUF4388 domain-containing protein [Thermoanaerobaculia bacterium]